MIVMKFGGAALATIDRFKGVADIIKMSLAAQPTVVLSAIGDSTDDIEAAWSGAAKGVRLTKFLTDHRRFVLELGLDISEFSQLFSEWEELLDRAIAQRNPDEFLRASMLSYGERLSCRMMAGLLRNIGLNSIDFASWELGLLSDSTPCNAKILEGSKERVRDTLLLLMGVSDLIPIVTGFIAQDADGRTTTLGRGGSDLTATFVGAALGVDEVQLWKDVDGLLTADPKQVQSARSVSKLSFYDAHQLAIFNSSLIHQDAIVPASTNGTKVRIKNFTNPSFEGTLINGEETSDDEVFTIAQKSCKSVVLVRPRATSSIEEIRSIVEAFCESYPKTLMHMEIKGEGILVENYPGAFKELRRKTRHLAKFVFLDNLSVLEVFCRRSVIRKISRTVNLILSRSRVARVYRSGQEDQKIRIVLYDHHSHSTLNLLHQGVIDKSA